MKRGVEGRMEGGDESDRENSYSSRRPEVIHTNIPIRESQTPSEDVVMKISAMECKLLCSVAMEQLTFLFDFTRTTLFWTLS